MCMCIHRQTLCDSQAHALPLLAQQVNSDKCMYSAGGRPMKASDVGQPMELKEKGRGGGRAALGRGEEGGQGRREDRGGGRAGENGGLQPMLWRLWDTLLSGQLGSLPVGQEDGRLVSLETSDGFGLACLAHHIHSLGRGREGERGRERERGRGE